MAKNKVNNENIVFENDNDIEFTDGDVGEFEVVNIRNAGDTWAGQIVKDCEKDGLPEWLPEGFDEKCYETINLSGKRGIISKYYRLAQYVEKYGMENTFYKITRGEKKGDRQDSFVEFHIQIGKRK